VLTYTTFYSYSYRHRALIDAQEQILLPSRGAAPCEPARAMQRLPPPQINTSAEIRTRPSDIPLVEWDVARDQTVTNPASYLE
jgi:hypothetical protein